MNRLPWITLFVVVASLYATLSPATADAWIYDRQAIQAGEVWRLLTGHLVHLSSGHLTTDLLGFGLSGVLIECCWGHKSGLLYLAMGTGIGLALWVFEPTLARFGGLSGLAYGNAVIVALKMLARRQIGYRIAMLLLSVLILKIFMDFIYTTSGLFETGADSFVTVPFSHLVGVLIACTFFITAKEESRHVTV